MSDLKIALIAEGKTDKIVIKAALDVILETYTLSMLQPAESVAFIGSGKTGEGWCGVYRWCRQIASPGFLLIEESPFFDRFDIIIIHLDADVADKQYRDNNINDPPVDNLPCVRPCPPASDTVETLKKVILSWLYQSHAGSKTVFCIPSKCIETWVAIALYGSKDSKLLSGIECCQNKRIYSYLHSKPASERLLRMKDGKERKMPEKYQQKSDTIRDNWQFVEGTCQQAKEFGDAIRRFSP